MSFSNEKKRRDRKTKQKDDDDETNAAAENRRLREVAVHGRIVLSGIFTGIRDGIVACPVPMQS